MTPTSKAIMHLTESNERWDLLAWKYYGDASKYSAIIMANPNITIEAVFEPGLSIAIPVLLTADDDSANLPPWRRGGSANS